MASFTVFVALAARLLGWFCVAWCIFESGRWAYDIRLFAIKEFGPVIHEFDPWFNYRATEYLAQRGWSAFFKWFDHSAWYPLGRPVATTIYPGMQIVSVAIWQALHAAGSLWSLNDVCCYVPAWFGAVSAVFVGLLSHECSGATSAAAAVAGMAVMAIIPAHASRSVGGGFDNESVAVPFMCATFYLWCRALRSQSSWPFGALAGLAYGGMVASWGGHIFALNVIGAHVGALLVLGYHSSGLFRAYSTFLIVGTSCAVQVPVVGWTPFTSMEQIGPLVVGVVVLLVELKCKFNHHTKSASNHLSALFLVSAGAILIVAVLVPSGMLRPFSGRVRALFIESATKTGNPLVDSVTEHQPTRPDAYWRQLHFACYGAPAGTAALALRSLLRGSGQEEEEEEAKRQRDPWPSEAALFLALLGGATYFFSQKMSRLVILLGPSCSALSGVALGCFFDWAVSPFWQTLRGISVEESRRPYNSQLGRAGRLGLAGAILRSAIPWASEFKDHCFDTVRYSMSGPRIMYKTNKGQIVDDYREAYWWLRDNTAEDARVMAWWDYGYQISGLANRTTLADGNTWNIEHIGLIGLCLSSPVEQAHTIARHMADYILVWAKDDVGKSTHFARISNSVYGDHCAESDCDQFGIFGDGRPSEMMGSSLIWYLSGKASSDGQSFANGKHFKQVYLSKHGKVRIVKVLDVSDESRAWAADTHNRLCDAPGSWYCPGQYPPQLRDLFDKNATASNPEAALYQKAYAERVTRQNAGRAKPNGPGLPQGSFLGSCRGCSMTGVGSVVRCTHCKTPGRPSGESSIDLSTCPMQSLDNSHGALICAPEPNGADIPRGAYLGSCKGCKLTHEGQGLRCTHCGTADGRQIAASYDLLKCRSPGALDNQNGVLKCLGLPNAQDIPDGGYKGSCSGCHMDPQVTSILKCALCGAADGRQLEASYDMSKCPPPATIDNANGVLTCAGIPNGPDIPPGGYRDSCSGCRLIKKENKVRCLHCTKADGSQVETSFDMSQCEPPSELDNQDGKLSCVRKNAPNIPEGSYMDSCAGCRVRGSGAKQTLLCSHCNAANGPVKASIVLDCKGDIGNNDGRLTCST